MLKFFEKGPFAKWTFLQRAIRKHRAKKRTRTGFKTFDTSYGPPKETLLDDHDDSEIEIDTDKPAHEVPATLPKTSRSFPKPYNAGYDQISRIPFHVQRRNRPELNQPLFSDVGANRSLDTKTANQTTEANQPASMLPSPSHPDVDSQSDSISSMIDHTQRTSHDITDPNTRATLADLDDLVDVPLSRNGSMRRAYSDENVHWSDEEKAVDVMDRGLTKAQSQQKIQYTSLTSRRSSKLRASLRELKKKSVDHVENVKQKIVRRVNAMKYENMNDNSENEQEIVEYERSPGSKRREFGSALRRSIRRSGKYVHNALSNSPSLSLGVGLGMSMTGQKLTTV